MVMLAAIFGCHSCCFAMPNGAFRNPKQPALQTILPKTVCGRMFVNDVYGVNWHISRSLHMNRLGGCRIFSLAFLQSFQFRCTHHSIFFSIRENRAEIRLVYTRSPQICSVEQWPRICQATVRSLIYINLTFRKKHFLWFGVFFAINLLTLQPLKAYKFVIL